MNQVMGIRCRTKIVVARRRIFRFKKLSGPDYERDQELHGDVKLNMDTAKPGHERDRSNLASFHSLFQNVSKI